MPRQSQRTLPPSPRSPRRRRCPHLLPQGASPIPFGVTTESFGDRSIPKGVRAPTRRRRGGAGKGEDVFGPASGGKIRKRGGSSPGAWGAARRTKRSRSPAALGSSARTLVVLRTHPGHRRLGGAPEPTSTQISRVQSALQDPKLYLVAPRHLHSKPGSALTRALGSLKTIASRLTASQPHSSNEPSAAAAARPRLHCAGSFPLVPPTAWRGLVAGSNSSADWAAEESLAETVTSGAPGC